MMLLSGGSVCILWDVVSGGSVPTEVVEDLLDLLCFYNSAEPPEIHYIEELHFGPYKFEKKKAKRNVWK